MKLSAEAIRLWNLVRQRPANYTDTEIKRDLGLNSKAALMRAVDELEQADLLTAEVEDDDS